MLGGYRTDAFKYFKASYSEMGRQSGSKLQDSCWWLVETEDVVHQLINKLGWILPRGDPTPVRGSDWGL